MASIFDVLLGERANLNVYLSIFTRCKPCLLTEGFLDYSALVVPEAEWDDLDPLEFERFRRFIRESRGQGDTALLGLPDMELAKALGAVETPQGALTVRVLGLLLFGKEEALQRFVPTHEVAFQVLSGEQVEPRFLPLSASAFNGRDSGPLPCSQSRKGVDDGVVAGERTRLLGACLS